MTHTESLMVLTVGISFKISKRKRHRITHIHIRTQNMFLKCHLLSQSPIRQNLLYEKEQTYLKREKIIYRTSK